MTGFADPDMWHPKKGFTVFWRKILRPNLNCILSYIKSLPSEDTIVILAHPSVMGLAELARASRPDLKLVLFFPFPTMIRTYHGRVALGGPLTLPNKTPMFLKRLVYGLVDATLDVDYVPDLNALRRELGLPAISHFFTHLRESPDVYVTLFPDWYSNAKPDYPQPLISGDFLSSEGAKGALSSELEQFLAEGPAPLLFTASTGSVPVRHFFQIATGVVRELNARAIFVCRFGSELPTGLPPCIVHQEYAPFETLLPRVSTVVHYGGIGTLAEACKAGIPQLLLPLSYDQFDNALIAKQLGIARSIPIRSLTKRKLTKALTHLLQSRSVRSSCREISGRFHSRLPVTDLMDRVLAAV